MRKATGWAATLALGVVGAMGAGAEEVEAATAPPSVAALAWMTGTWAGPVGAGVLEENWTVPKAGAIQALVRMTADGKTSMVELIVIEEEAGTLMLRLQQWDPGLKPRTDAPATMKLLELGEQSVTFEAVSEAQFATLGYARDGDAFTISIEDAGGNKIDLPLRAVR